VVSQPDDRSARPSEVEPALTPVVEPGVDVGFRFHARLNQLWSERKAESALRGRSLTNRDLSRWLIEHGYEVSDGYISHMLSGRHQTPSLRLIEGLARFFGVDPSYLLSDATEEAELQRALADTGIRSIALRAVGLSPSNLEAIRRIAEETRRASNLPPIDTSDEEPVREKSD
jgi:transcriptional regulator with XRE-family HTH domain